MKYASQINIVIVVVALVAVGYAVSQTIWKLPVTPSIEAGGGGLAGVSSREGSEAPVSFEMELSGRENPLRQSQSSRPAAFQPTREPGGGSRANRQPTTTSPRQEGLPAGLYPGNSNPAEGGARVITTRPGSTPKGGDPIQDRTASERRDESVNRSTEASLGSSPSGAPNSVEQRPGGSALSQERADPSARGARRNRQPPPPPARSSNR